MIQGDASAEQSGAPHELLHPVRDLLPCLDPLDVAFHGQCADAFSHEGRRINTMLLQHRMSASPEFLISNHVTGLSWPDIHQMFSTRALGVLTRSGQALREPVDRQAIVRFSARP